MASLRMRWGRNLAVSPFLSPPWKQQQQLVAKQLTCFSTKVHIAHRHRLRVHTTNTPQAYLIDCPKRSTNLDADTKIIDHREEEYASEQLDQLMTNCVVEIVKNIGEAPFLGQIYGDEERMVREKAVAERWPLIRRRWERGGPTPSGLILVEELKSEQEVMSSGSNRVWGVLIQGKGISRTACYILKTCRVESLLGSSCTHFTLVRVDCFVDSAQTQLQNLWLQR